MADNPSRNSIRVESFDILKGYLKPSITPVLSNLTTALLSVDHTVKTYPEGCLQLRNFIKAVPNLTHLRLNFVKMRPLVDDFMTWLGGDVDAQLQHLRDLDLGMLNISSKSLLQVLTKWELNSLALWKVGLDDEDSAAVHSANPDAWTQFLRDLANNIKAPLLVKSIKIGYATIGEDQYAVHFAGSTGIDGNGEKTFDDLQGEVNYRKHFGSFASDWLNDLADRIYLPFRHQRLHVDEENPSAGSDDEDENMDAEEGDENEDEDEDQT
jgi:hypothetical protein